MKNNIKLAIVSDAIYPYNKGGKEKRIYELSTRLAKKGYEVHIYCMKWWKGNSKHIIENGVHLHAVSKLYPLYSGQRRSIKQAVLFSLACFKLIAEDFDVIDVDHMPHMVLFPIKIVCLLKNKKLYATWNEVWGRLYWREYLGNLGNIAYIIEYLSARMPDTIIAVSEHTKEKLITDLQIKKEIYVIPNGIDLTAIEKIPSAKEKSDIIFAGRLLSHKNVDILLQAIKIIKKIYPRSKAIIIGEGPEKRKLEKLAKTLGIEKNVTFPGFLEKHSDLYAYMKSSKVFVFPSTREGFGITALEANACGLPVITTDHNDNATKYLIADGHNGYVTKLTAREIAEKTLSLFTPGKKKNTYAAIQQYDWELISNDLKEVYTTCK